MHQLKPLVELARTSLYQRLNEHGITDPVIIRIRPVRAPTGLACYRSFSQFQAKPIIGIDSDFDQQITDDEPLTHTAVTQALRETLYHEYGHVICEMAKWGETKLQTNTKPLKNLIAGTGLSEEDFCEALMRFWRGWLNVGDPSPSRFKRILTNYRKLVFQ